MCDEYLFVDFTPGFYGLHPRIPQLCEVVDFLLCFSGAWHCAVGLGCGLAADAAAASRHVTADQHG